MAWKVPEKYRISPPKMSSRRGDLFGWFQIPSPDKSRVTSTVKLCLASDGMEGIDWEHISVRASKNIGGKWSNRLQFDYSGLCRF